MTRLYTEATTSSHKTLYEKVLLACALAPVDPMGLLHPRGTPATPQEDHRTGLGDPSVRPPSRPVLQRGGPVLERRGGERRWRYRFIDPMMRPYLTMRAYQDGMDLDELAGPLPDQGEHPF